MFDWFNLTDVWKEHHGLAEITKATAARAAKRDWARARLGQAQAFEAVGDHRRALVILEDLLHRHGSRPGSSILHRFMAQTLERMSVSLLALGAEQPPGSEAG